MKVLFCFSGQQPGEKKPETSQNGIAKLEEQMGWGRWLLVSNTVLLVWVKTIKVP